MTKPKLAIFGGTFDPVHLAHLHCALYVQQLLGNAHVQLMPCHLPAHRGSPGVSAAHRAAMLELAIANYPGLTVQYLELEQHRPSYTVDSLRQLHLLNPEQELYFVLGSDSLAYFKSWKNWQEILELSHLLVCQRPGFSATTGDCEHLLTQFGVNSVSAITSKTGAIVWLDNAPEDLSATQLRLWLQQPGQGQHSGLDPAVLDYIRQHQLYQSI